MLQVRFDPEGTAGLALVWTKPQDAVAAPDYSRAADLLFAIIGGGGSGGLSPRQPAAELPQISRADGKTVVPD